MKPYRIFPGILLFTALALAPLFGQEKKSDAEKPDATGTWKWKFEIPNGDTIEPVITLRQEGDKLTGNISMRGDDKTDISEGKISGEEVSFKVYRERDGRKVTTSYNGKISGNSITGKMESDWSGEKRSFDWNPTRSGGPVKVAKAESNLNATGAWKWSFEAPGGDTIRSTARLKQEGNQLTGTVTGRNGMEMAIKEGRIEHDEVTFKVERKRDDQVVTTVYNGTLKGDSITGKFKSNFGGQERTVDWLAKREKGDGKDETPLNVSGTWKWNFTGANGQSFESSAKLKQEGAKLTGTTTGRGGAELDLQEGKVEQDAVSFKVVRERDGNKITSIYKGKVSGNSIKGTIESDLGGQSRSREWDAQRVRDEK